MGRKGLLVAAAAVAIMLSGCSFLSGLQSPADLPSPSEWIPPFGCGTDPQNPLSAEHACVITDSGQTEPLQEVIPSKTTDAATLEVTFVEEVGIGIEGTVFFVKLSTPDGTVALDRRFLDPGVQSPAPLAQPIPPGDYRINAYYRTCDANCGFLDPPRPLCAVDVSLVSGETRRLQVSIERARCRLS
jgi:hypothetical protein